MKDKCILCNQWISQWMLAGNKITLISIYPIHKSCLQDWKLRTGKDWTLWDLKGGRDDWS